MFAAFIPPYPFRGIDAPYLWVYYRLLTAWARESAFFIMGRAYARPPAEWLGRWELDESVCDRLGYAIPDSPLPAQHSYGWLDESHYERRLREAGLNPLEAFRRFLCERDEAFEDELGRLLNDAPSRPEAILTPCNVPSLQAVCALMGIPVIHIELGALRAPLYWETGYLDFQGVNGNTEFAERYSRFPGWHLNVSRDSLLRFFLKLPAEMEGLSQAPDHRVGVVLQVEDDSNLVAFGNGMTNLGLLTISQYGRKASEILVRAHPGSRFILRNGAFDVDDSSHSLAFLARCESILTINSSMALEAMLAGKPVKIYGEASYGLIGDMDGSSEMLDCLAFYLFSYLTPFNLQVSLDYLRFRLGGPSEEEIIFRNLDEYMKQKHLDPEIFSRLPLEERVAASIVFANQEAEHKALYARLDQECASWQERYDRELQAKNEMQQSWQERYDRELQARDEIQQQHYRHEQELLADLMRSRQELNALQATRSWRLTKPLRSFAALWRGDAAIYFVTWLKLKLVRLAASVRARMWPLVNSANAQSAIQAISDRRCLVDFYAQEISSDLPDIDISVVTYNSERWVGDFFASLDAVCYPKERINLYLVDNGSSDQTFSSLEYVVKSRCESYGSVYVCQQGNVGFGAGHDAAIKKGKSKYILVTNIDMTIEPDALHEVVSLAEADEREEVASWELRQMPYEHPKYYDPISCETNWSSHACILMRRSAYTHVGGYDRRIFMYAEDVELSYRFRSYGYKLKYCPSAVVNHFSYEQAGEVKPLQFLGSTIGNFYLRLRYGDFKDKLSIIPLSLALLLMRQPFPGARKGILLNLLKLVRDFPFFLSGKGPADAFFAFREFDYEMIRDGAFYECKRCMDGEKVSIVIRTYRGRTNLLRQAISSVFNQTYRSIEVVVVEDGGEAMRGVVSDFKPGHGREILYLSCPKVGRSVTGNTGLKNSTGSYVMFLDDDDLIFPDHVETLMSVLLDDVALDGAYSLAMQIHTIYDDSELGYKEMSFDTPQVFRQEFSYEALCDHNFLPIQSVIFKREIFVQRGGFEEDMEYLEDWNLWLRYCYKRKFFYIPKTTSMFRVPADHDVKLQRHMKLHAAYDDAKARAMISNAAYGD